MGLVTKEQLFWALLKMRVRGDLRPEEFLIKQAFTPHYAGKEHEQDDLSDVDKCGIGQEAASSEEL